MKIASHKCKDKGPNIIMGGIQIGPCDRAPSPLIAISYPTREAAEEAGKFLLSVQNGTKPLSCGPEIYVGDTNIKIFLTRLPKGEILCEVFGHTNPKHLTCSFYVASKVSSDELKVFSNLIEAQRHYILTVAHGKEVLLDTLNLVKYVIERRGI